MPEVDSIGAYRGTITTAGMGSTKKGYPQWVVGLAVTQKYATTPAELEHFGIESPAWVDWSENQDTALGFFVLFNNKDAFDESSKLLSYDQVMIATGWDGQSFDALNDGTYVGTEVMFRVEAGKPYVDAAGIQQPGGKLQVSWIDKKDASPERSVKALDDNEVKAFNGKLNMPGKKKAAPSKAAKPVGKPAAAVVIPTAPEAAPVAQTATIPAPTAKKPPKSKAPTTDGGLTRDQAWEFVNAGKGDNDDAAVEDAWLSITGEVQGDRLAEDLTPQDWKKVADLVLKDLG